MFLHKSVSPTVGITFTILEFATLVRSVCSYD
jgi:hypothetical protein